MSLFTAKDPPDELRNWVFISYFPRAKLRKMGSEFAMQITKSRVIEWGVNKTEKRGVNEKQFGQPINL